MANVGKSGESEQTRLANEGEFSESDQFFKKTILASTQIRQKWQISGEYSNLLNSPASSHCLENPPIMKDFQTKKNPFFFSSELNY